MSEDGSLHQISEAIGDLRGELRGIRDLMVDHQSIADKAWDRIDAELRNVKHDYRNVEQKVEGVVRAQSAAAQQVAAIEEEISGDDGLKARLGTLERLVKRALAIVTVLMGIGTFFAFILAHYGVYLFKWLFGRA